MRKDIYLRQLLIKKMSHFPNLQNNTTNRKGIIKNFSNEESSYANSVLQSLSSLDFALNFKNDIENKNIKSDPNFLLSYDLYKLISNIISGKDYNSLDIIDHFKNKYNDYKNNITNGNVLEKEPFYFLYFLLQFIHFENNEFKDPNYNINIFYNQPLENQKNEQIMLKAFNDFMDNTQNSIISKNFYIFMKYTYNCPYCGSYYRYLFRNILKINLDNAKMFTEQNFPDKKGTKLSLDDGLNYYFSTIKIKCKNEKCQNNNVDQKMQIFDTKNILIIIFEKDNKMINYDLSFERTIDLTKYRAGNIFNNSLNNNFNFELKSCIYYDKNSEKYLSICLDNNNGNCYKYVDNKCEMIKNYMCDLEPKILLYEKCTGFAQKNNFSQNNSINCNNQINNYNQANNFNQFNINNNQSYNNFNQGNNNGQFYPNNNMNIGCNINNNINNNQFNFNNNFNNMNQFNNNNNFNNMNQFNNNNNFNNMNQFNINNNNSSNAINNNNNQINGNDNFKYIGNNQFNQNNYNNNNNKAFGNQNFINKSIDINQNFSNPLKNINKESINEFNKIMNFKGKNTVNSQKIYNNYNSKYCNDSL